MAIPNPKFEQHLTDKINQAESERTSDRYGIIMSYDHQNNTATVLLSSPDSDSMGDLITRVPCPTFMGVQSVAPEPGRPCWVAFKGGRESFPIITTYFNHDYEARDFKKSYTAKTSVPRYHSWL